MWIVYFILVVSLLVYLKPKIYRVFDSYSINLAFNKLVKGGYKVIKNDPTGYIKADYFILSKYGLHIIQHCVFAKRNTYLAGDEIERTWSYYEPYILNPKAPSGNLYEGPPANANRIDIYNPINELEETAKKLDSIVHLGEKAVPIFPVVLITPKIKAVNINRKHKSSAYIVFTDMLYKTIINKDTIALSKDEVNHIEHILAGYMQPVEFKHESKKEHVNK